MKSILPCYIAAQQHDFALRGAFGNWYAGIFDHTGEDMPRFWSPVFTKVAPDPVIAQVTLQAVDIVAGVINIKHSTALGIDVMQLVHYSSSVSRWESNVTKQIGVQVPGTFILTFEDNVGREFHTAPFHISNQYNQNLIPLVIVNSVAPAAPMPLLTVLTSA